MGTGEESLVRSLIKKVYEPYIRAYTYVLIIKTYKQYMKFMLQHNRIFLSAQA